MEGRKGGKKSTSRFLRVFNLDLTNRLGDVRAGTNGRLEIESGVCDPVIQRWKSLEAGCTSASLQSIANYPSRWVSLERLSRIINFSLVMSGSGKGLLGLWLYRNGEEWALKEASTPRVSVLSLDLKKKVKLISLKACASQALIKPE